MGFAVVAVLAAGAGTIGESSSSKAAAVPVELVSQGSGAAVLSPASFPSISADGQLVDFSQSITASAAVVAPILGWVRDRGAPATTLIPAVAGLAPNSAIGQSVISRDGCFVAYAGVNPKQTELVGFNRCATPPATTMLQSLPSGSSIPFIAISAHGRYVAYNAVDPAGGPTSVVWIDRDGNGNGILDDTPLSDSSTKRLVNAGNPSLGDEQVTALVAVTSQPVSAQFSDVVLWDPPSAKTTIVSAPPGSFDSVSVDGSSAQPSLSPDGHFLAFASAATNLVSPPLTGPGPQIFVYDVASQQTVLVSRDSADNPGNSGSVEPSISADGTQVAFATNATNLLPASSIPGDPVAPPPPTRAAARRAYDLLVAVSTGGFFAGVGFDRVSNQTDGTALNPAGGVNDQPVIASNGRSVAFTSSFGSVLVAQTPPIAADFLDVFVSRRPTTLTMTGATFTGLVVGDTSGPKTLTVTNAGTSSVLPATIISQGDFSIVGGTCKPGSWLSPGQSCTIAVVFKPTAEGPRNGTVTLAESGFEAMTISATVKGTGTVPATTTLPPPTAPPTVFGLTITPNPATFGTARVGTAAPPVGLLVTNTGNAPVGIAGVVLGGAHPADFAVTTDGCAGVTLAPGGTCPLTVTFTPKAAGARTASLKVSAAGGSATAALNGSGTFQPTLRLSPNVVSLGMVGVAVGAGFPPGATIQLRWNTRANFFPATADAAGKVSVQVPVGPDELTGNRLLQVVDEPGQFAGISTPALIVDQALQPPTDRNPAFAGITSLILRG